MKHVCVAAAFIILLSTACSPHPYTCTDPLGCLEISPGSPVVIGLLYTSTGPYSQTGSDTLAQVEQAITDRGTLLGHEIGLIREGSDCTPEGVFKAATRLALHGELIAVIQPECGEDLVINTRPLEAAGISLLRPSPSEVYAAVNLLFANIEKIAVRGQGKTLNFPRTAVREALEETGYHP